jgi:plasmid stabilization system protein ParE
VNRVPIVIEPEAKSDIRVARDYYSDKGENTSERFRDELNQVLDLLSDQNSGITPHNRK